MAVVTVRPNGSDAAAFTVTGAASAHAALSDNSDSSFIRRTSGSVRASAVIDFGTTTIASGSIVSRVRLRARARTPDRKSNVEFALGVRRANNQQRYGPALALTGKRGLATYEGPWQSTAPAGGIWTQPEINEVLVRITDLCAKSGQRAFAYELYVDVDVIAQPTVTVTAPSGQVTNTSRPNVQWSFSDAENQPQAAFEVRVYTLAETNRTGFTLDDRTEYPPVWETGQVAGQANLARVGVILDNDDYVAYVRAARSVGAALFFSAWQTSAFEIDLTRPDAPTLTGTHDPAEGVVELEAVFTALGTAFGSRNWEFQRSVDGLEWYSTVDGLAIGTAAGTAVYEDYFAPRGGTAFYRARQIALLADEPIPSPYGTATVVVPTDGLWWFKPLENDSLTVGGVKVAGGFSESFDEQQAVFRPVGREGAVVVSAGLNSREGSFTITTVGRDEWLALRRVLRQTGPVYVEFPDGTFATVRWLDRDLSTSGRLGTEIRQVRVNWVEV